MNPIETLTRILKLNRIDSKGGVYSVCSSNEYVIEAALVYAKDKPYPIVIEATSNQVNQDGGYTGMKPEDFVRFIKKICQRVDYPFENIILGGDHLGPNTWTDLETGEALEKSKVLVKEFIKAGFRKIHLDASMACKGDITNEHGALSDETVAEKAAVLCNECEAAWKSLSKEDQGEKPVYIIGTEVPTPGGSKEHEDSLTPTSYREASKTYETTKAVFNKFGLNKAWDRVIAMVVQPGVEFGDDQIFHYDSSKVCILKDLPREHQISFEAHSTDYQTSEGLADLVKDHFCILKVGPWYTYAFREALLLLNHILLELMDDPEWNITYASFKAQMRQYLLDNPKYWEKYYKGDDREVKYKCLYSLSDRIRYYWNDFVCTEKVDRLLRQFDKMEIPISLISMYFSGVVSHYGMKQYTAKELIQKHIGLVSLQYEKAII